MLERTYAITSEVLEPITFVLAYHTVLKFVVGFFHTVFRSADRRQYSGSLI